MYTMGWFAELVVCVGLGIIILFMFFAIIEECMKWLCKSLETQKRINQEKRKYECELQSLHTTVFEQQAYIKQRELYHEQMLSKKKAEVHQLKLTLKKIKK